MNPENELISEEAKRCIKTKEKIKEICDKFANIDQCPPDAHPVSVFMAGSPGAGKTEFSRSFIKQLGKAAVRIDADEIKKLLPQFTGCNAEVVQGASALGVEKLYDFVLYKKQNVVLDGTFADYNKSISNIRRSLDHGRIVSIFYIFQLPVVAWELTKAREAIEHRNVPKDIFIEAFFASKENVNKAKKFFQEKVELNVVIKNYEKGLEKFYLNVDNVDSYLTNLYNKESLEKMLLN